MGRCSRWKASARPSSVGWICAALLVAGAAWAEQPGEMSGAGATGYSTIDDARLERLVQLHYRQNEQVQLVLLPTSVTDRKGRVVRGLDRVDFKLYEDQVPQEIRYFSSEAREPISVAFMLDVSGSMRQLDKLWHAKEAIRFFVSQLQPNDAFGLICFADDQVVWVTEFTSDSELFLKRLAVQEGYGQTALNDAVAAAPGLVDETVGGRKAIILITDGVDNFSRLSFSESVELARRVNVPIFTLGFLSIPEERLPKDSEPTNLKILDRVSDETGGRLFAVYDPDDLKEAVTFIQDELRFQYLIGYYPSRRNLDGDFRRIQLESDRSRLQIRTRTGYYAAP